MSNVTQEQCFGSEKLDIFKIRGTKAAITDFAIALGGFVYSSFHVDSDTSLKGRTGYYWTKSDDGHNDALMVGGDGSKICGNIYKRYGGARPISPFSSINTIPTNGVSGKLETDEDGVEFVYDGYYPQTAPEKDIQAELNRLYGLAECNRNNRIPEVCEVPDSFDYYIKTIKIKYKKIDGYRYNGKIYVRMELKQNAILSNGERYSKGDSVWFEVEPIKRLISEQDKITITEKIIYAGVPFNFTPYYKTEDFEKTVIYKFTNEIWDRDVERLKAIVREEEQKVELEISDTQTRKNRELILQNSNPDKNREAIIIQSGNDYRIPTLIRSQSGISNYTDDERAKAKYYIEEIKIINPELAKKYYEKYKKIIENASSDLKIQQDVKNKLDDLIQELREFYNKNIFVSKYVDKINYTINAYKKNASQITIDEMLEKLNKYRMGIFKLIEYASDRDEINEKFAELQAICMTIYYKYYKSEENQNYFKDIKPENTSESICLINFLNSLEIDDSYFIYIIENIDIEDVTKNADLFYNAKLWDIVADYYDIIELADAEVVTENQNNLGVAIPNNQRRSLVYSILVAIQQNFINVISSLFKNSSEVDKSNTETLEFWKDLDFDRLISLVSDKFKIEFERERLEKEGIPERVQLPDTKIFKPSNEEIIYRLLKEAVIKKYRYEYIDKNGISKIIIIDSFYRCFFNPPGRCILFNYKSPLMFPTLAYIYEIGRLIGTMNGLEKCIEELMKGKKIHFSEIERDDYGNKKPSAYSSIFKYAEKSWERVEDKLKSTAFHDIIGKAERDREEHYNRILGKDSKGLIGSLKVKPENMIPVETHTLPKNRPIKPDDHEY